METLNIDWEQFDGIVDLTDPECIDIYNEFVENGLRNQLVNLREVCAVSDHAEVGRLTHRIRGGCLTFGMTALVGILETLEDTALAGGDVSSMQWYEQSVALLEEFTHAVDSRRKQLVLA